MGTAQLRHLSQQLVLRTTSGDTRTSLAANSGESRWALHCRWNDDQAREVKLDFLMHHDNWIVAQIAVPLSADEWHVIKRPDFDGWSNPLNAAPGEGNVPSSAASTSVSRTWDERGSDDESGSRGSKRIAAGSVGSANSIVQSLQTIRLNTTHDASASPASTVEQHTSTSSLGATGTSPGLWTGAPPDPSHAVVRMPKSNAFHNSLITSKLVSVLPPLQAETRYE